MGGSPGTTSLVVMEVNLLTHSFQYAVRNSFRSIIKNRWSHTTIEDAIYDVNDTPFYVDPTYPYRLTIRPVSVEGDIDASKIFRMAVMNDELFVVYSDQRREINVFDVSKIRELDNVRHTTPKLAKADVTYKNTMTIEEGFDIFWIGVS